MLCNEHCPMRNSRKDIAVTKQMRAEGTTSKLKCPHTLIHPSRSQTARILGLPSPETNLSLLTWPSPFHQPQGSLSEQMHTAMAGPARMSVELRDSADRHGRNQPLQVPGSDS